MAIGRCNGCPCILPQALSGHATTLARIVAACPLVGMPQMSGNHIRGPNGVVAAHVIRGKRPEIVRWNAGQRAGEL